jgi:RNA polymerase sigma-70 factor, ECF subfamily
MTADLIQRAQQGDHAAFEELIRAAYDRLYAIAYRIIRERLSAEDAVQDAIVRCWRDLRALRDHERFDGWLHRLLVNACRDEVRRGRRRPIEVYGHPIDLPVGGDEYARVAAHDELERAFLKLPADQRIALVLTHYVGYSGTELAAILGVPAGTVHSRLHYGARAMRAALVGPDSPRQATTESAQ